MQGISTTMSSCSLFVCLIHVIKKQPQLNFHSGPIFVTFDFQGAAVTVGGGKAADTAKGLAETAEEEEDAMPQGKGQGKATGHSSTSGPPLDGMQKT